MPAQCRVLGSRVDSINRWPPPEAPRPVCRGRPVGKTHRASGTRGPRVCVMGMTSGEVTWGQGRDPEAHRGRRDLRKPGEIVPAERGVGRRTPRVEGSGHVPEWEVSRHAQWGRQAGEEVGVCRVCGRQGPLGCSRVWALPSAGMGWTQGTDPQLHTTTGNPRSTTDGCQCTRTCCPLCSETPEASTGSLCHALTG